MKKHTLMILATLAAFASCSAPETGRQETDGQQLVTRVYAARQQAVAADGVSDPIITDGFSEGDKLYFSQLPPAGYPNFGQASSSSSSDLYVYEYREEPDADWNKEFNFVHTEGLGPVFDWETVKNVGSVGNAFSMYAFYYPLANSVRFDVEQDQRGSEDPYDKSNFLKSDIMGAYHATSSLYTRMRFRLFHLMVYLKVTLYVPVYDDQNTYGDLSFSGFRENAVRNARVMNASTGFNIEWRAKRSSDTEAPLTQSDATGARHDIIMYRHEPGADNTTMIDIKDFYPNYGDISGLCSCDEECTSESCKGSEGGACTCDKVQVYHFSVLFPSQSFGDRFLCFELQDPQDEGKTRYYYFSGSQIVGDSGNYSLTQGTLQELAIYLPRMTNETILVNAKILPWAEAATDMTVTKNR